MEKGGSAEGERFSVFGIKGKALFQREISIKIKHKKSPLPVIGTPKHFVRRTHCKGALSIFDDKNLLSDLTAVKGT